MKFADWNASKRYSEHTAPGWIPENTTVQFKEDRTTGRIVHGNGERSLIEYHPSGGGWQREWFNNSDLRVQG
jgi:hypothetical protein